MKLNSWSLYGSCTEIKATIFIRIATSASLRPWATQREICGAPWEHCQAEKKNRDLSHKGRGEYRFGYLTSQCRNNELWKDIGGYPKVKTKCYGVRKKAGVEIGNWNSKQGVFVVGTAVGLGVPLSWQEVRTSKRKCHHLLKTQGLEQAHGHSHSTLLDDSSHMIKLKTNRWRVFSSLHLSEEIIKFKLSKG